MMPVRNASVLPTKAAYSVSETARDCGLSRARFWELTQSGIMPGPWKDPVSGRSMYPAALHDACVRVRQTNQTADGRYVIFNCRRQTTAGLPRSSRSRTALPVPPSQMQEIVEHLSSLGVTATEEKVAAAVKTRFPTGIAEGQFETALTLLFRDLRRPEVA